MNYFAISDECIKSVVVGASITSGIWIIALILWTILVIQCDRYYLNYSQTKTSFLFKFIYVCCCCINRNKSITDSKKNESFIKRRSIETIMTATCTDQHNDHDTLSMANDESKTLTTRDRVSTQSTVQLSEQNRFASSLLPSNLAFNQSLNNGKNNKGIKNRLDVTITKKKNNEVASHGETENSLEIISPATLRMHRDMLIASDDTQCSDNRDNNILSIQIIGSDASPNVNGNSNGNNSNNGANSINNNRTRGSNNIGFKNSNKSSNKSSNNASTKSNITEQSDGKNDKNDKNENKLENNYNDNDNENDNDNDNGTFIDLFKSPDTFKSPKSMDTLQLPNNVFSNESNNSNHSINSNSNDESVDHCTPRREELIHSFLYGANSEYDSNHKYYQAGLFQISNLTNKLAGAPSNIVSNLTSITSCASHNIISPPNQLSVNNATNTTNTTNSTNNTSSTNTNSANNNYNKTKTFNISNINTNLNTGNIFLSTPDPNNPDPTSAETFNNANLTVNSNNGHNTNSRIGNKSIKAPLTFDTLTCTIESVSTHSNLRYHSNMMNMHMIATPGTVVTRDSVGTDSNGEHGDGDNEGSEYTNTTDGELGKHHRVSHTSFDDSSDCDDCNSQTSYLTGHNNGDHNINSGINSHGMSGMTGMTGMSGMSGITSNSSYSHDIGSERDGGGNNGNYKRRKQKRSTNDVYDISYDHLNNISDYPSSYTGTVSHPIAHSVPNIASLDLVMPKDRDESDNNGHDNHGSNKSRHSKNPRNSNNIGSQNNHLSTLTVGPSTTHLDTIRSLDMDTWSDDDLRSLNNDNDKSSGSKNSKNNNSDSDDSSSFAGCPRDYVGANSLAIVIRDMDTNSKGAHDHALDTMDGDLNAQKLSNKKKSLKRSIRRSLTTPMTPKTPIEVIGDWTYKDVCRWLKKALTNEMNSNDNDDNNNNDNGTDNDLIDKILNVFETSQIAGHVLLVLDKELLTTIGIDDQNVRELILKLTNKLKENYKFGGKSYHIHP